MTGARHLAGFFPDTPRNAPRAEAIRDELRSPPQVARSRWLDRGRGPGLNHAILIWQHPCRARLPDSPSPCMTRLIYPSSRRQPRLAGLSFRALKVVGLCADEDRQTTWR